jgi:hypothetical protein
MGGKFMNFTPKINVGAVVIAVLTIAMAGWIGLASRVASTSEPMVAIQGASGMLGPFQTHNPLMGPAVERTRPELQPTRRAHYQPISSKSKHWWKRNAPIVGGAGGGALVGGLLGGGTGALVGGAVGGGGGYLYKRSKRHHYHKYHQ